MSSIFSHVFVDKSVYIEGSKITEGEQTLWWRFDDELWTRFVYVVLSVHISDNPYVTSITWCKYILTRYTCSDILSRYSDLLSRRGDLVKSLHVFINLLSRYIDIAIYIAIYSNLLCLFMFFCSLKLKRGLRKAMSIFYFIFGYNNTMLNQYHVPISEYRFYCVRIFFTSFLVTIVYSLKGYLMLKTQTL